MGLVVALLATGLSLRAHASRSSLRAEQVTGDVKTITITGFAFETSCHEAAKDLLQQLELTGRAVLNGDAAQCSYRRATASYEATFKIL